MAKERMHRVDTRSEEYYATKTTIFNALIDTIDLGQLAQLDAASAREEEFEARRVSEGRVVFWWRSNGGVRACEGHRAAKKSELTER